MAQPSPTQPGLRHSFALPSLARPARPSLVQPRPRNRDQESVRAEARATGDLQWLEKLQAGTRNAELMELQWLERGTRNADSAWVPDPPSGWSPLQLGGLS